MFEFEFDLQPEYQKSITVEDIGDFGIIASTIEGAQYYMAVKTKSGKYVSFRYEPSYLDGSPELRTDFRRDIAPNFNI